MAIGTTEKTPGVIKRFLTILFYPAVLAFHLLFRRPKEEEVQDAEAPPESAVEVAALPVETPKKPDETWPESRLEICERLWGDGCLNPFSADYLIQALQVLKIDETKSLLQLGAGIGGTTRAIVGKLGVWTTGFEVDEKLVEIAGLRNQIGGTTKRAAISRLKPAAPKFKKNGFNAALIHECLTSIEDKTVIIQNVVKSLRSDGHFIMVDYVLPGSDPPNAAVTKWYNFEPEKPKLWTSRRTYDALKEAGLEVRVAEDFTAKYRSMVLDGWLKLLSGLTKDELTPEFAVALIKECEYWLYRINALDSGGLKVYRYHGIKYDNI